MYHPIEDYGLIGDLHTVALCSRHGSIDWLCLPHFDSPSVFGALLDDQKGGTFQVCPPADHKAKQNYWPETNILVTRFLTDDGVAELIDYMPAPNGGEHHSQLIRSLRCVRGRITLQMRCLPAFNYARDPHELAVDAYQATFSHPDLQLQLDATFPLAADGQGVTGSLDMQEGDEAALMLYARQPGQSRPDWDCTVAAANSRFR